MYKGFLVNKDLLANDPHFARGCPSCHRGDENARDKDAAHKGLVKRPSEDLSVCGTCHEDVAASYRNSLHFSTAGLKHGGSLRFSPDEKKIFSEKVFGGACNSCHATCGDCHVKGPAIGGVSIGLLKGHKFVRRDEGKTCAACHGGRVYPEFTGEYGGSPDVHYQKGMMCMDCHNKREFHGDGKEYRSRREVAGRPSCVGCHPAGQEKSPKSREAHGKHGGKLSCVACHASAAYRNCYDCHLGKGATAKPGFILGLNPRDRKTVTTLRLVPTVRDTFEKAGIKQAGYDTVPNYWDTIPHNIRKRTERTRSCEVCHVEGKDFLIKETLIKGGAKANEELIRLPKKLK